MSRELKVYGWNGFKTGHGLGFHNQTREIVAAKTKTEAATLGGFTTRGGKLSLRTFNEWACETGNAEEVKQAMSKPGGVFWHPLDERECDRKWRSSK